MTRASQAPLLSLDEAADALGRSAIALVEAVRCHPARLARLLYGRGRATGLGREAAAVVARHRQVLAEVRAAGLGWIVDDQVEGALSYAGANADASIERAA